MTPSLRAEIDGFLTKKTIYYKKFSQELIQYLEETYPTLPTLKSKWYMVRNNLSIIPTCKYKDCNQPARWNERNQVFDKGCCKAHSQKITSLEHYGVEHPNQSKKQQEKVKQSMKTKYGVSYITQTKKHKDSVKKSTQTKYGVDNVLQLDDVREKIKKTNLKKYGVEEVMANSEIRKKAKQTMKYRYGYENALASPDIRSKANQTNLKKYGSIFPMRNDELLEKRRNHIIEKYDAYSPLAKKEDEDRYYHLDNSIEAENRNEIYNFFFSYEFKHKQKQIEWITSYNIKSHIDNIEIKSIMVEERDLFITENSLYQIDSSARQNFGVFSNGELVAIISGYEKQDFYEITRFVTKIGYKLVDTILDEFIKYNSINKNIIITFDRRYNNIYHEYIEKAGFEFEGGTEPNIYYITDDDIINGRNIRMIAVNGLLVAGYKAVWDCGKLVYKRTKI